jgi:hypothetical protein
VSAPTMPAARAICRRSVIDAVPSD